MAGAQSERYHWPGYSSVETSSPTSEQSQRQSHWRTSSSSLETACLSRGGRASLEMPAMIPKHHEHPSCCCHWRLWSISSVWCCMTVSVLCSCLGRTFFFYLHLHIFRSWTEVLICAVSCKCLIFLSFIFLWVWESSSTVDQMLQTIISRLYWFVSSNIQMVLCPHKLVIWSSCWWSNCSEGKINMNCLYLVLISRNVLVWCSFVSTFVTRQKNLRNGS